MSAVAHGYHQGVLEDVMFRETAQTLPWVGEGALWMAGGALDAANSQSLMHGQRATPNHIDHSGIPLGLPVNIRRLNLVRDADGFYENGPISTTLEPDTESSVEERQADNDGGSKNKRGRRAGKSEHRKRAREARRAAQVGDSIAAGIAPSSFPATRGGMRRTQSLTSLNRLSRIFDDEVTALMSINKNESSARSKPTTRGAEDRYAEKENMRPNASMLNNGGKSLSRARLPISRENMVWTA